MLKRLQFKNNLLNITLGLSLLGVPQLSNATEHHKIIGDFYREVETYFWKKETLVGLHPNATYKIEIGNSKFGFSNLVARSNNIGAIQVSYLPNSYQENTDIRIKLDKSQSLDKKPKWHLYKRQKHQKTFPKFLETIGWNQAPEKTGKFYFLPASIPFTDTLLTIPTEKNNISVFMLFNPVGEIIWASIPNFLEQFSSSPCETFPKDELARISLALICKIEGTQVLYKWNKVGNKVRRIKLFHSKLDTPFSFYGNKSYSIINQPAYLRGLMSSKKVELPKLATLSIGDKDKQSTGLIFNKIPSLKDLAGKIYLIGKDLDDDRILIGSTSQKYYWISQKVNKTRLSARWFSDASMIEKHLGKILTLVKKGNYYYSLHKPKNSMSYYLEKYQINTGNKLKVVAELKVDSMVEENLKKLGNFNISDFTADSFLLSFHASDTSSVRVHDAGIEYVFHIKTHDLSRELLFSRKVSYYPSTRSISTSDRSPFLPIALAPDPIGSIVKKKRGI